MTDENNFTYRYYKLGDRPVKVAFDGKGRERTAYSLNWKTLEFERWDSTPLSKPNADVESLTEDEFNNIVRTIKTRKKSEEEVVVPFKDIPLADYKKLVEKYKNSANRPKIQALVSKIKKVAITVPKAI